jgi:DNA processing protein
MEDFKYIYFLTKADGLGSVRLKRLLDKFGEARNILEASEKELINVEGINVKTARPILDIGKNSDKFEKDFALLEKKMEKTGAGAVTINDKDYPHLLKKIYDPPAVLYYKGKRATEIFKNGLESCIGIVGTRNPSDYGKKVCEQFSAGLAELGIGVISGFARGIDTIAHKTVLSSKNDSAVTAAVFGNGIDVIYPPENKKLYDEMFEYGLLLSEFELSAKPDSMNFPRRNRIISGLSLGLVVIESGKEGGALITARCALDQGREVYAVPGDINSRNSKGTNDLIKNGQAKLVENIDDILDELRIKLNRLPFEDDKKGMHKKKEHAELKGNEKTIFVLLDKNNEAVHIDAISELTGLNISDCLVNLLNLEFKGLVKQLPGKMFTV